jgi:hypothetical protein
MRHKITMSGLLALCGLALLVQHVAELGSNFHGDNLVAGRPHAHGSINCFVSAVRTRQGVASVAAI